MTTYLWIYDAAGSTNQWPTYTPEDVKLAVATPNVLSFTGTIADGVYQGESLQETYQGRFSYVNDTPTGRVGSVEVSIGGELILGARYDDPLRVRSYATDFAERMDQDVSFRGNASANYMETGAGNDSLVGGAGNDGLQAGDGNDRLFGGEGSDTLVGGDGSDTMVGGAGNDLYLVDGLDRLAEARGGGRDSIGAYLDYRLPLNFEVLSLIGEATSGWGNGTRNWIAGNEHGNHLYGLAGGDALGGLAGADTLEGGLGNDSMLGGFGADRLIGGAGNDLLDGGALADWLVGGAGADTFAFARPSDSATNRRDVIVDFTDGDRIDLSAMDARRDHAGNDKFTFIGAHAFDGTSGELHYARGLLSGDVDGDRLADFVIRVNGAPALDSHDLIL